MSLLRWGTAAATLLLAGAAFAADVKITGIHNCCPGCTRNITAVLEKAGATSLDIKQGEVSFSSSDADGAVKALFDAGYSGKVSGAKAPEVKGLAEIKGSALKVEGVHLCCGACVAAVNGALSPLGKTDAKPRVTSFVLTSDKEVSAAEILKALHAAGFNAKIAK